MPNTYQLLGKKEKPHDIGHGKNAVEQICSGLLHAVPSTGKFRRCQATLAESVRLLRLYALSEECGSS